MARYKITRDYQGIDVFYYNLKDGTNIGFDLEKYNDQYIVSEFDDKASGANSKTFDTKKKAEEYIKSQKERLRNEAIDRELY